ncbi:hypothetical protein K491DRAFT_179319 [Lophiostoma macrostomum CBS 122681]|uniref:Uncharacterized protein n=1 Tax=Lophiostoma macrostomum CBS 122681 TaxID=1314788 RepID=A0A6A6TV13_9PLEO|nr:hypothetical protein K491DRAFT_179319 [Lophiostoma macrostomum CBS 122681]
MAQEGDQTHTAGPLDSRFRQNRPAGRICFSRASNLKVSNNRAAFSDRKGSRAGLCCHVTQHQIHAGSKIDDDLRCMGTTANAHAHNHNRNNGIGARCGPALCRGAGNFRSREHRELCVRAGPTVSRTWRTAKLHVRKRSKGAFPWARLCVRRGASEVFAGWAGVGAVVELTPNRHVADG